MKGAQRQMQMRSIIAPTTRPVLNQKQSTETVQMMLFSAISVIFYHRGLFPIQAYDRVFIEEQSEPFKYDRFVSGSDQSVSSNNTDTGTIETCLLRKGRSSRVDSFFKILENGVFDALQRKVLSRTQIALLSDAKNPNNVLETYTFTVKYCGSKELDRQIEGLQLRSSSETLPQEDRTYESVVQVIQQVGDHLDRLKLHRVPEDGRYLSVNLTYVDGCDDDYEPPGFQRAANSKVSFPSGNGWGKRTASIFSTEDAFHKFGMTVAYVKRDFTKLGIPIGAGAENMSKCDRFDDTELSSHDQSLPNEARTACSDTKVQFGPTVCKAKQLSGSMSTSLWSSLPSNAQQITDFVVPHAIATNVQLGSVGLGTTLNLMHLERSPILRISEPSTPGGNTEEDRQMKLDLDDMCAPQHFTQNSVPTQLASDLQQKAQLESQDDHQNQDREDYIRRFYHLSREKAIDLWMERSRPRVCDQHRGQIRCQCGFQGLEEDLVSCEICGTSQHLQCYGYLGLDDTCRPGCHVCYACLVKGCQSELLVQLSSTAQLRQAMHLIFLKELYDETALTTSFADYGLGSVMAMALVNKLILRGYVERSRRTRHSQSQGMKLHAPATTQGRKPKDQLLRLFDPLLYIADFYNEDVASDVTAERRSSGLERLMSRYHTLLSAQGGRRAGSTEGTSLSESPVAQTNDTISSPAGRGPVANQTLALPDQIKRRRNDRDDAHASRESMSSEPSNKRVRPETSPLLAGRKSSRSTSRNTAVYKSSATEMLIDFSSMPTPDRAGASDPA